MGHFSLWGDFDADEISLLLGLKPSIVYPKGETTLDDSPALVTTWDLYCPPDLSTGQQIEFLLERFEQKKDVLRSLTEKFRGAFNVIADAVVEIQPSTMQRLIEMKVSLNLFVCDEGIDAAVHGTGKEKAVSA